MTQKQKLTISNIQFEVKGMGHAQVLQQESNGDVTLSIRWRGEPGVFYKETIGTDGKRKGGTLGPFYCENAIEYNEPKENILQKKQFGISYSKPTRYAEH